MFVNKSVNVKSGASVFSYVFVEVALIPSFSSSARTADWVVKLDSAKIQELPPIITEYEPSAAFTQTPQ